MKRAYSHLFGPVPSRRLGLSLGVDLTPFKTCTLNCIFCQLGPTLHQTCTRQGFIPVSRVEAELARWAKEDGQADVVTLAGSGEPTLHIGLGDVIDIARRLTGIRVALLSNGTLFWDPAVRRDAGRADIVKLSLSAWDPDSFKRINRPHPDLRFRQVVDGMRAFRQGYAGTLWLEVFLVRGLNTEAEDVERIAALAATIRPDAVHLNTAVRPPAVPSVSPVSREDMEGLAGLFRPRATVVADSPPCRSRTIAANEDTILAMLRRRPCTAEQIATGFAMHPNEVSKYLGRLCQQKKIQGSRRGGDICYTACPDAATDPVEGS